MKNFEKNYPEKISIIGKIVQIDKGGSLTQFYFAIILVLFVISIPMLYWPVFHWPLVISSDFLFLFVAIFFFIAHATFVQFKSMIFANQTYIDYEKSEISIINIFGMKTIIYINDIDNLSFSYKRYFLMRAFYYKIFMRHEKMKIEIMSSIIWKKDAREIAEYLNNSKQLITGEDQ